MNALSVCLTILDDTLPAARRLAWTANDDPLRKSDNHNDSLDASTAESC